MLANRINRIAVVGGGLKGWLASCFLKRVLGAHVQVTILQSRAEPLCGSASRSTPAMTTWLRLLSISEVEFMTVCSATFRCGSRFVGWSGRTNRSAFLMPFFGHPDVPVDLLGASFFPLVGRGFSSVEYWKRSWMLGKRVPFVESQALVAAFFESNRAPRVDPVTPKFASAPSYGYHFDTVAFVGMLRSKAKELGVEFVNGQIEGLQNDPAGNLRSIKTTSGEELSADLFIDCTGSPDALLHRRAGGRFESSSAQFPCDSVVSFDVPWASDEPIPTYSTIEALPCGWAFEFPLADRACRGYVFSDRHTTAEAAERELRTHIGIGPEAQAHRAKWSLGRSPEPWVKNCIAVGHASSAIDDIAGTQLLSLGFQLANLVNHLPDGPADLVRAQEYNRVCGVVHESIQDFVALHYAASSGLETPFWEEARERAVISERVKERIRAYESGIVISSDLGAGRDAALPADIFDQRVYTALLSGMGHEVLAYPPILDHMDLEPFAQLAREQKLSASRLEQDLPEHRAYLRAYAQP